MQAEPYPIWKYYPSWREPPEWVPEILDVVSNARASVDSTVQHLQSNEVLALLRPGLSGAGFMVEEGAERLPLPVLFGENGHIERSFNVDGFREEDGIALEVESGGAFENNRVLYDLFKMLLGVNVVFGVLIVPQRYETERRRFRDQYIEVRRLFDAIWANPERLRLPIEGLLLIGY